MTIYEIISLVFSGINLISLVFLIVQIHYTKEQIKQSYTETKDVHEEQRRIKTVEVLNNWNEGLKKETRLAEKIVESLDYQECVNLYEYTPFKVSNEVHRMICQMCSQSSSCKNCNPESDGKFLLDGSQLTELRGHVTSYLNNLEVVAVAWQQGIVDKEVIEMQFSFLYRPGKKSALHSYRSIAGEGNSYPALNKFYDKIKQNKTKILTTKPEQ